MSLERALLFVALALSACTSGSGVAPIESTVPEEGALNAACSSDGDCDEGLSCNTGRRICVECIVDSDCTETESCEEGACAKIPRCMTDEDCPDGVCDRERELCATCVEDEDCDESETCIAGECEMQGEDDSVCPDGSVEDDAVQCDDMSPSGVEPDDLTIPVTPGSPEPDPEPADSPSPTPEPAEEPSNEPVMAPEPANEPVVAPSPESDVAPEPASNPEPTEPVPQPTSGTPAVMIVAERGSSMFAPYILDAGEGCYYGGSPPYGDYPSRWEAVRATVASFEDLAGDIDFWAATYTGEISGTCPILSDNVSAASGFGAVLDSLPPTESACLDVKGESPTAVAIENATDALLEAAPTAPKYLLLFTRGTPDTCLVPDPQCGGDKAVGAVQAAFARGVTTLVVSLHDELDVGVSEHLAQAGQGQPVAPFPEVDTGSLSCLEREYSLEVGAGFDYEDWRPYAAGTYAPTGFVYAETLSYTGLQASELRATLGQIAMGSF